MFLDVDTLAVVRSIPRSVITNPESMCWSPDGQFLLVLCKNHVYVLHMASDKIVFHDTEDISCTSRASEHLTWSPDSALFTYLRYPYNTAVAAVHGAEPATPRTTVPGFWFHPPSVWVSSRRMLTLYPKIERADFKTFDDRTDNIHCEMVYAPHEIMSVDTCGVSPSGVFVAVSDGKTLSVHLFPTAQKTWTHTFDPIPEDASVGWSVCWGPRGRFTMETCMMFMREITSRTAGRSIHAHIFHLWTPEPLLTTIDLSADGFLSSLCSIAWSPDNRYIIVSAHTCKHVASHLRYDLTEAMPASDRRRFRKEPQIILSETTTADE